MKKKLLLISVLSCIAICKISAEELHVPLQVLTSSKNEIHNAPIRHAPKRTTLPTVKLNENQLTVDNVVGDNVSILLYGIGGEIIISQSFPTPSKVISLSIPTDNLDVLQEIIITIDGITYWGEF